MEPTIDSTFIFTVVWLNIIEVCSSVHHALSSFLGTCSLSSVQPLCANSLAFVVAFLIKNIDCHHCRCPCPKKRRRKHISQRKDGTGQALCSACPLSAESQRASMVDDGCKGEDNDHNCSFSSKSKHFCEIIGGDTCSDPTSDVETPGHCCHRP